MSVIFYLAYTYKGVLSFSTTVEQERNIISSMMTIDDVMIYSQTKNAENSFFIGAKGSYCYKLYLYESDLFVNRNKGEIVCDSYRMKFDNKYSYPTLYFAVRYNFSKVKDHSSRKRKSAQDVERRF